MGNGDGCTLSPYDSKRFGFPIYRAAAGSLPALQSAISQAKAQSGELLIARFPADRLEITRWLSEYGKWILGDTLVHYRRKAGEVIPRTSLKEGFVLRDATSDDAPRVVELARSLFGNYSSHYQCNPRTNDRSKLSEGYAEWSARFILEPAPGKFCLLIERQRQGPLAAYIGFEIIDGSGHVTIGGVDADFQQFGFYRQLVEGGYSRFTSLGAEWVEISTQVQNFAVQKVWSRLGLAIFKAEYTVHIDLRA